MPVEKKCDCFDKSCRKNMLYLSRSKEIKCEHTAERNGNMRYTEGFTGKAILAMKEAIHAAEEFGHTYIGSEHLLLGLMEEGGNAAASALAAQQLNTERLRNGIVDLVDSCTGTGGLSDSFAGGNSGRCQGACQRCRVLSSGNGTFAAGNYPRPLFQCSHHSEEVGCQSEPALHALQQRHCLWGANGTKPYGYPFPQKLSGTVSVRKADDRPVKSLPL